MTTLLAVMFTIKKFHLILSGSYLTIGKIDRQPLLGCCEGEEGAMGEQRCTEQMDDLKQRAEKSLTCDCNEMNDSFKLVYKSAKRRYKLNHRQPITVIENRIHTAVF